MSFIWPLKPLKAVLVTIFWTFLTVTVALAAEKPLIVYIQGPKIPNTQVANHLAQFFHRTPHEVHQFQVLEPGSPALAQIQTLLTTAKAQGRQAFVFVYAHGEVNPQGHYQVLLGEWMPLQKVVPTNLQPLTLFLLSCHSGACIDDKTYTVKGTRVFAVATRDLPSMTYSMITSHHDFFRQLNSAVTAEDFEKVFLAYAMQSDRNFHFSKGDLAVTREGAFSEIQKSPPSFEELTTIKKFFQLNISETDLLKMQQSFQAGARPGGNPGQALENMAFAVKLFRTSSGSCRALFGN